MERFLTLLSGVVLIAALIVAWGLRVILPIRQTREVVEGWALRAVPGAGWNALYGERGLHPLEHGRFE